MEVIKSREFAKTVTDSLDLETIPEFNPSLRRLSFFAKINPLQDLIAQAKGILGIEINQKTKSPEQLRIEQQSAVIGIYLRKLHLTQLKNFKIINIALSQKAPN